MTLLPVRIAPEQLLDWAARAMHVVVIIGLAWLLARLARRLLARLQGYSIGVMARRGNASRGELEKRSRTILTALRQLVTASIWLIALLTALPELIPSFRIEPLLAGLGIAGLSLGLGAQTLIKDWLGGLFLLLEDQIRIGDSVTINGVSGDVVEMNLRTTVLRAESGAVHVIPNGSITSLANLTREYSYYLFETTLAHGADAVEALEILRRAGEELAAEEPFKDAILGPLEVMGVERLGERGATLRARIKTLPSKQYLVGRELNLRVKERFDRAGIAFPPPYPPKG
ncbi:MAG TPA: mechanosensitive ion channel family protein [Bryobacteraceae bacterium]|nr:mechanosensitive ion channel family protein [Bryobacteraceae bacterium]